MAKTKSLTIVENPLLDQRQMAMLVQKTPKVHIKEREGRGKKTFRYVSGSYVTTRLNEIFGWLWTFEVKEHGKSPTGASVWVLGRLTVSMMVPTKWGLVNRVDESDGKKIYVQDRVILEQQQVQVAVKEQFGGADIKRERGSGIEVDYADDLKAAATDALKKCASSLGIAADIYSDPETSEMIQSKVSAVVEYMKSQQEQTQKEQDAN